MTLEDAIRQSAESDARVAKLLADTEAMSKPAPPAQQSALARVESASKAVIERFEREKARLYRPDGAPVFSEKAHDEKMAALREPVRAAKTDLIHAVDEALANAKALDIQVQGSDPVDTLSADELTRAAALAVFVGPDVAQMRLVALADRLQAILQGGDKSALYSYFRAASQRHGEIADGLRKGTLRLLPEETTALGRIYSLLADIRGALADPKITAAAKQAVELRKQAAAVRAWALQAFDEADGSAARYRSAHMEWARNAF